VTSNKRVRVHLADPHPGSNLPSIEGLLVSKRRREILLAVPQLLTAAGANPTELESRYVAIPLERVAFYEVLT
jgi:hypothetical protein